MDLTPGMRRQREFERRRAIRRAEQHRPHGSGRNGQKRRERAVVAKLKGQPGGWKKGLRIWQEHGRMLRRGVEQQRQQLAGRQVPPHRSGGGQL